MKFDALFNQVFLSEKANAADKPEIDPDMTPVPEMFDDDVEPLPTIDSIAPDAGIEGSGDSSTLMDHITAIEDLVEKINGVSGDESLQKLVNSLDKEGTPFEGIVQKTSQDIIRSAEILSSLAEQLKGFMLGSSKVAAPQQP